ARAAARVGRLSARVDSQALIDFGNELFGQGKITSGHLELDLSFTAPGNLGKAAQPLCSNDQDGREVFSRQTKGTDVSQWNFDLSATGSGKFEKADLELQHHLVAFQAEKTMRFTEAAVGPRFYRQHDRPALTRLRCSGPLREPCGDKFRFSGRDRFHVGP